MANNDSDRPTIITRNLYAAFPSLAMLAGMQLDVFTPLKDGPLDAASLAGRLKVRPEKLSPLLYALVTADLLTVTDDVFANTKEADTFLVRGRPDYIGWLSGFYNGLWQAGLKTAQSIRTGKPQAKRDWEGLNREELMRYFRAQYPSSLRAGKHLVQIIDFSGFRHLLDAGGGSGGLSIAICEACAQLTATVADLQAVIEVSKLFISEAKMSDRITTTTVDLSAAAPRGQKFDVAVIRALLQVLPPEQTQEVLKNIFKALKPDGHLYLVGNIVDDAHLFPPSAIAFSLVFLNAYDDGGAYTRTEYQTWLETAGFVDVATDLEAMADGLGIVSARKPV